MTDDAHQRARLKSAIARRLQWRSEAFHAVRKENTSPRLAVLRAWQAQRLERSFEDVLRDYLRDISGSKFEADE